MVSKYTLILLLVAFLASCAQVGVISGGDEDLFAPKPITEKVNPPNATTNFQGNSVIIPFDEYFKLNNPVKNIRMIPPHATITAEAKGKSLKLSWDQPLEANTTYAIYMNNAILDLTEGNDSIMQYVFSTGSVLDTLTYSVGVMDAWSNEPIDDCVVALYQPMTNKLVSFADPDHGIAKLKYLRPGEYRMVAFVDENNDLEMQDYEQIAFPEDGKVKVDSNYFDSIPMRMYKPTEVPKITKISERSPCVYEIEFSEYTSPTASMFVNGAEVDFLDFEMKTPTAGIFTYSDSEVNSIEVVVQVNNNISDTNNNYIDTMNYRIKNTGDTNIRIIGEIDAGYNTEKDHSLLYIRTNGWLKKEAGIDPSFIHLENVKDSSIQRVIEHGCYNDEFALAFNGKLLGDYKLILEKGALNSVCAPTSAPIEKVVTFFEESDYGEINVNLSDYSDPVIVQLLQRGEIVRFRELNEEDEKLITFSNLLPGEYSFRVIRDLNENGRWDVGDYSELKQPEQVDFYSKKTKVRANWSIDITLTPTD